MLSPLPRASLQTGRYPARIGITDWIRARFQVQDGKIETPPPYEENGDRKLRTPSNPYWMELEEVTIAELLKTNSSSPVMPGNGTLVRMIIILKNRVMMLILQVVTWDNLSIILILMPTN